MNNVYLKSLERIKRGRHCLLELSFALLFTIPSVGYYLNYCLQIFGIPGLASQVGFAVVFAVACYSFCILFLKRPIECMCLSTLIIATFLISIFGFGNSDYFVSGVSVGIQGLLTSNMGMLLIYVVPIASFISLKLDVVKGLRLAYPLGVAALSLQITAFALSTVTGRSPVSNDYMSFAYYALCPLLTLLVKERTYVLVKVVGIISVGLVIVSGCRGALVTLCVFIIAYLALRLFNSDAKGKGKLILAIVTIGFLLINIDSIALLLMKGLSGIGFTSRSLEALIQGSGSFMSGSGRNVLYSVAIDNVSFIGTGLFGDRSVMDSIGSGALDGASISKGAYVHNWILELLLDFGWFFGGLIVLAIIVLCIKGTKSCLCSGRWDFAVLAAFSIAMIFGRYLLSASLFISPEFSIALLFQFYIIRSSPDKAEARRRVGRQKVQIGSESECILPNEISK